MTATLRLPGIQFDAVPPAASDALVRMDIATFVGFAASGPLHQPVAVEDISHFQEIFGGDLALASDPGASQPVYAYLPSAVRAFFRNGGRRCWVIRVAGKGAKYNRFSLPGLSCFDPVGRVTTGPAMARARSQGSWSDGLVVDLALRSQPLAVARLFFESTPIAVRFDAPASASPGDLLKVTFPNTKNVLWVFIDSVKAQGGGRVTVTSNSYFPIIVGATPSSSLPKGERVTMDMFVQSDQGESWSLTDLGFAPNHPRYWASLPDDATLYGMESPAGLTAEAAHPRFPLAGPGTARLFLPLNVGPLPRERSGPKLSPATTRLERDGVANFVPELFLDASLNDTATLDLLSKADYIRYQSSAPRPRTPIQIACGIRDSRRLTGIHAALAIPEATIISAPDAVQRGWFPAPDVAPVLPSLQKIPATSAPPASPFQPCNRLIVTPPVISISGPSGDRFSLHWPPMPGAVDFLQEAVDPAFATAEVIYQGTSGEFTIYGHAPGDYYYRVRRQINSVFSDYSNEVAVHIPVAGGWQVADVSDYKTATLLVVHQALLRMSAARGDLFAVLSMPEHYREQQSTAYAAQLSASLGSGEQQALSFGGLYHPWLIGREENDLNYLRATPPDGVAAGVMSQRSFNRGPWISPANEPLHGVVALTPFIAPVSYQALQDARINLVRQEPDGFLCLSGGTLSQNPDLGPINVRRLLSLLRKTALLVGADYVFEPNDDVFRRSVQRGFEKMLDDLCKRGAFAGRTSREGFQVVTDSRLNTAEAMDAGRFFVELRVAPSLPLRFLTVRLVQTADRTLVTEGQ
jgi:hypothetical protein